MKVSRVHRRVAAMAVASSLALLAACGSDSSSNQTPSSDASTASTEPSGASESSAVDETPGTSEGSTDSQSAPANDSRVLRIVTNTEPPDLEICNQISEAHRRVLFSNVSESLTRIAPDTGEVEPVLATEWTQDSPTEWTFTLREGVKFHDGSDFNAETAATAINRVFVPELVCNVKNQGFGDLGVTAEATGDYQLLLTTSAPDPILPRRMFNVGMTGPATDPLAIDSEPVGTGPYVLESWERAEQVTLQAFEGYWGDAPPISTVTFVFRPEDTVRQGMIEADEADIALAMSPNAASSDLAVTFPGEDSAYLTMPTAHAPFDDIRVRRAVDLAIDRQGLIDAIWAGTGEIPTQAVASNIVGFNPDVAAPIYDQEAAKALIADAVADGVDVGAPVVLHYRLDRFFGVATFAEAIQTQLNEIGLNVESLMGIESSAYFDFLRTKDIEGLMIETAGNSLGDASLSVESRFVSALPRSRVPADQAAAVDEMALAAREATGDERATLYQELFAYVDAEVVQDTPIATIPGVQLVRADVNYTPSNDSSTVLRLAEISFAN